MIKRHPPFHPHTRRPLVHGTQAACRGFPHIRIGGWAHKADGSIDLSLYVPTELTFYHYWLQLLERHWSCWHAARAH